jgi:hypothetical protein
MRIGIIGGGITGVCTALELAENGCSVDLFEADGELISQASFVNEGKIHLGFVYAKDTSLQTATKMIRGALAFKPLITRWIQESIYEKALSSPFIYAVHRESMVPVEQVRHHFQEVEKIFRLEQGRSPYQHPGLSDTPLFREMAEHEWHSVLNPERIGGAFLTVERSVDPMVVARELRSAIASHPEINVFLNSRVESCQRTDHDRIVIRFRKNHEVFSETYDQVVNVTWQNRLALDHTLGIREERPLIHRFKLALHSKGVISGPPCPSITFILGSFGDTVTFDNRMYWSWYPAGHILTDSSLKPPENVVQHTGVDLKTVELESIMQLGHLIPSIAEGIHVPSGGWEVRGGYISAWGETGIEDPGSRLHERYEVGVSSHGHYHSVDTGKYTLAPVIAHETSKRILEHTVR